MNKVRKQSSWATRPARSGKTWSGADIMRLQAMADKQIPAEKIAERLRRSEAAVRSEAAKRHVMLAPSSPTPVSVQRKPMRRLAPTEKAPYGGVRVQRRAAVARKVDPPQEETLF